MSSAAQGTSSSRKVKALLGKNHGVDDVNDTVGTIDVGLDHVGIVDHHFAAFGHDLDFFAVDRLGFVQLHDVLRHDLAGNNVIGEDRD